MDKTYKDTTKEEVDQILKEAQLAFYSYRKMGKKKAQFLRAIANEIESLGNELVEMAMKETSLPEPRIIGERGRTTGHLRMFADIVEEGSWVEARIDTANPNRSPAPKPDLRKMSMPIGPVVVFGASNFPLAYSTAGGDTAAALAAGCPVIVKAHPAHPGTSELVAKAIQNAIKKEGLPNGVFQHVHGGFEIGHQLVTHPLTKAVGFTGSFLGGKALFDLANKRPEPIPVFAEMGSTNPVILLPETLGSEFDDTAKKLAASITLSVGQFCTNPGLIFGIEGTGLTGFMTSLKSEIEKTLSATMLHSGIAENYSKKLAHSLEQKGVRVEGQSSTNPAQNQARPTVASVAGDDFLKNPGLAEEVFGPFSLIVRCKDLPQLHQVINNLHGQLTATVVGGHDELVKHKNLINALMDKAGRVIINGVPTGVEVNYSMHHGGPFPATTDSRFTAVGGDSIKRFVRPVAFQNCPDTLLPEELQEKNPLNIWRLIDSQWKK